RDCALLFWTTGPQMVSALDVLAAWGFAYKTFGFVWIKTRRKIGPIEPEDLKQSDLRWGMGYTTRANAEVVLLATRPPPRRLSADGPQMVVAPHPGPSKHSAKPEEVRRRIEHLYGGPYLELYGRKKVAGWTVWGNEIQRERFREAAE